MFEKNDFFSSGKNLKVLLLCKLDERGIIKKCIKNENDSEEHYSQKIIEKLDEIKRDLEG